MGETSDQIERHIAAKRDELRQDLRELAQKVTLAMDWRYQFRNHTAIMIAAAFGAGVLLSLLLDRRLRSH